MTEQYPERPSQPEGTASTTITTTKRSRYYAVGGALVGATLGVGGMLLVQDGGGAERATTPAVACDIKAAGVENGNPKLTLHIEEGGTPASFNGSGSHRPFDVQLVTHSEQDWHMGPLVISAGLEPDGEAGDFTAALDATDLGAATFRALAMGSDPQFNVHLLKNNTTAPMITVPEQTYLCPGRLQWTDNDVSGRSFAPLPQ